MHLAYEWISMAPFACRLDYTALRRDSTQAHRQLELDPPSTQLVSRPSVVVQRMSSALRVVLSTAWSIEYTLNIAPTPPLAIRLITFDYGTAKPLCHIV